MAPAPAARPAWIDRHHDDLQFRIDGFRGAKHTDSIASLQCEVGQHERQPRALHVVRGLWLVARLDHAKPVRFERQAQSTGWRVRVFDDQLREGTSVQERTALAVVYLTQPAGTPARRASSWISITIC